MRRGDQWVELLIFSWFFGPVLGSHMTVKCGWDHMCWCCCLHWKLVTTGVLAPSARVRMWCKYLAWIPSGQLFGKWCQNSEVVCQSRWMIYEWMCEEGRSVG